MDKSRRILRIVAIILMVMTTAMTVLGGAGTSCAAFSNNVGYLMAFKGLMDYSWLYQGLVITTVLIGLAGIQYFASMTLRWKAAPANLKFYINILTLVVFFAIHDSSHPGKGGFLKTQLQS